MIGAEFIILIVIFAVMTAVAALVFCVWLVAAVIKGLFRATGGPIVRAFAPPAATSMPLGVRCTRERCGAHNPLGARYCRRCGTPIMPAQQVAATRRPSRRAACW
jgi:hypothetical protein